MSEAKGTADQTSEPLLYVVDDDPAMRDALQALLTSVGLRSLAFSSAAEFLEQYRPHPEACLLLDIRMPGMSGLELQRRLIDEQIEIPVIVITGHGDVSMAVEAMKAGAVDFVEKPFREQALIDRVTACLKIARETHQARQERAALEGRLNRLSNREHQVLEQILEGKPSKVIGADLEISRKTVDVHRGRIMEKLGVKNVAELVRQVTAIRGR